MKKLVFVFALVAMAFGGSVFAQEAYQNNMGVYFDEDGTMMTNNDGVVGVKHVYLILSQLTTTSIEGFECKITANGGMFIAYGSFAFPTDVINVGSRYGEVIAGFGSPVLATDGKAVVMEFDIVVTDTSIPGQLFLEPVYFPSVNGFPAFLSDGVVVAAHNSTAPGIPVLVTNSPEEPVATDATSFDNLKSLYR